jgi:steroid delta-isomerase-like uncharacterized protein
MNRSFRAAFPDLKVTINDIIAEGDTVAARITWRGTHKGTYEGIPATGKKARSQSIIIVRIKDGKIAEGREQFDGLSFRQQLGAGPKE